jgi:predicted pyridoxine 5'-phosphate oxidase superfamily flavin-nucleotide-binding protein
VQVTTALDARQQAFIAAADTFFIASHHPERGADASHRGGRPGFARVEDAGTLAFPDYPGNNMFNTLGNLVGYPQAGLLFLDFEGGDQLQVTGRTQVIETPAPGVRFFVDEVRETRGGSRLRWALVEPSPANP